MHEHAVLAAPEAGVDLAAGEQDGQETLSLLHPLERGLELPAGVGIVQHCGRAGPQDRLEESIRNSG